MRAAIMRHGQQPSSTSRSHETQPQGTVRAQGSGRRRCDARPVLVWRRRADLAGSAGAGGPHPAPRGTPRRCGERGAKRRGGRSPHFPAHGIGRRRGGSQPRAAADSIRNRASVAPRLEPVDDGEAAESSARRQQMLRVDFENAPEAETLAALLDDYVSQLAAHDLVVLSDYGKGGLAHITGMIERARAAGKPVLVDPKGDDYTPLPECHPADAEPQRTARSRRTVEGRSRPDASRAGPARRSGAAGAAAHAQRRRDDAIHGRGRLVGASRGARGLRRFRCRRHGNRGAGSDACRRTSRCERRSASPIAPAASWSASLGRPPRATTSCSAESDHDRRHRGRGIRRLEQRQGAQREGRDRRHRRRQSDAGRQVPQPGRLRDCRLHRQARLPRDGACPTHAAARRRVSPGRMFGHDGNRRPLHAGQQLPLFARTAAVVPGPGRSADLCLLGGGLWFGACFRRVPRKRAAAEYLRLLQVPVRPDRAT